MDPYVPSPQPVRWRRGVYAAALVVPFTVAQIWALLVLLRLAPLDGLVGQAFLVTFAGSVAAVWAGWRWVWRLGSERQRKLEREAAIEAEARYRFAVEGRFDALRQDNARRRGDARQQDNGRQQGTAWQQDAAWRQDPARPRGDARVRS